MTILLYLLAGYYVVLFSYLMVLIFLLLKLKKDSEAKQFGSYPLVSIFIAARNEEENILSCLEAIEALSWPADHLEVLIGNDQSTDETEKIVLNFIKDKKNFRLINIRETLGTAKGKANVLAHLAKEAKADFFFITDADIQVPENWIQALLASYDDKMGIISGATITKGPKLFHYCQTLDWIYAFGMIKVVSDHNIPVSAVGNNMMISRKAYESTGGYEKIPFSVTEDLELFLATLKNNWHYKNRMAPDCLASTKPIESFSKLLSQRKRWMQGAVRLPIVLLLFLFVQGLFTPAILTTLYFFPAKGISIWIGKLILQQIFMVLAFRRIKQPYNVLKGFLIFEIYSGLLSIAVMIYYFIPTKVTWKGRKY